MLTCAPLRRLLTDRSVLALAQGFLRSSVVIDPPTMWWSTPGNGKASSAAAQLFHVDLDRLRWLNVNFLLSDVDSTNGPHVYVRTSQRRKPAALLRDGRYSDEEVAAHYPNDIVEIGGRRGTIFITDNRGFHKGKNLQQGTRLLFQMILASSSFGHTYPPVQVPPEVVDADFRETLRSYPYTYTHFAAAT
jgi:hypothetical protein